MILSAPVFLSSCKKKKKKNNTVDTTSANTGPCKLDHRAPRPLIADMRKNEFKFEWITGKMTCEAFDDSSRVNFDVHLRMRKDSVIWLNVLGPLNIKIARILITKDSVKFIQFQDGTLGAQPKCFQGDFVLLSQMLQTDVDFDMMQSLLVGNSVSFYEEDEKLRSSINQGECRYSLSTVRKRKMKKVLEGQKPPQDPFQTISLDPTTYKILNILFLDEQSRTFKANYSAFAPLDSMQFPYKAEFFARGLTRSAGIIIEYVKITLNKPTDFPFSIPDDCVPIVIPANEPAPH
ncbi:MAG TPA: DUF4292 domain-containing protein [Bacteroidia bacterium]|nr:DUF4292 domain-containing protein [Bacteroidia bacterium]